MAALEDAFGFTAVGLVFFVGHTWLSNFVVVGHNRIVFVILWHIGLLAMEGAVYVVVAAVWARRVSGCVGVPAASVGGGGGWRGGDGAARCGLGWSGG